MPKFLTTQNEFAIWADPIITHTVKIGGALPEDGHIINGDAYAYLHKIIQHTNTKLEFTKEYFLYA